MNSLRIGFLKEAYKLQPHQQRAIDKLDKTDQLLLYHSLGSGKTLTSLAAGKKFKLPIEVVGPASLKHNFPKEKKKHNIKTPSETYTYSKPPEEGKGLVVFDEAHRMGRMESKQSKYPDTIKGKKTLFMTGTPLRNYPSELIPLLRGLDLNVPRDREKFRKNFIEEVKKSPGLWGRIRGVKPGVEYKAKNLKYLEKALKGKVDYHKATKENFPSVNEQMIEVEMTPEQQDAYDMALKGNPSMLYKLRKGIAPSKSEARNLNAFLNASRQISNYPGKYNLKATMKDAPKLMRAVSEIEKRYLKDPNYRGVTYSNYLDHGIMPLTKMLSDAKIPYAVFSGKQSDKEKAQIIKDYNSGKIKQLLISGAGSEGIDLKGTKLMQILEPHWNKQKINQVKGRAVRYKSHSHLPEGERNVEIQRFSARPRKRGLIFKTQDVGTDKYLRMMGSKKEQLNKQFLEMLQRAGTNKTTGQ